MLEIKPNEIAPFWEYPVVDIPIENLSVYIKRNISLKPGFPQWESIDPGTNEMLRFPMTEQDLLNVLGPGDYHIFLKFKLEDGRHGLYGNGVYIKVGMEEKVAKVPPAGVAPTPSPGIEMLKAILDDRTTLINTMTETLNKVVDAQKSSDRQFKEQLLLKLIDKVGDSQVDRVDVGAIYSKVLDISALFASKRLDLMAGIKKGEAELKRQESEQKHEIEKHEIALINIQQRIKAGKAGRAELKNDGSPKDDAKKTKVVPEFVEKVKPTLEWIKDIINIAQGMPLVDDTGDEGGEGSEEAEPLAEEEQPAEEPAPVKAKIISLKIKKTQIEEPKPAEDDSPATAGNGAAYDPNDPRKQ